jgi:quercetin dioxygenase-like cupin family protein
VSARAYAERGYDGAVLVIRESEQELVEWRPGVLTRLRAGALVGTERLSVLEQWHEPGCGAPTHTHHDAEELVTVLEGVAEFWIEDEHATLEAGSTAVVPPFRRHGFRNAGEGTLHVLAVLSAAEPLVEYDEEAGAVFEIGGRGDDRRDAHRAVRRP